MYKSPYSCCYSHTDLIPLVSFQAQWAHNIQLKDDAAASLGPNHIIFKAAAHFVKDMEGKMMAGMGIGESAWQSEALKEMRAERFKVGERKLLEWAGVDVSVKTV